MAGKFPAKTPHDLFFLDGRGGGLVRFVVVSPLMLAGDELTGITVLINVSAIYMCVGVRE